MACVSWRFSDLMAMREDRDPRVDNPIGCVVGIPLKRTWLAILGDVRKCLGRSCVGRIVLALDRASIDRCSA